MITCPKCHAPNNDTARFCIRCATPLVASLSCPSCGTANSPQARFCMNCAAPLRAVTPAAGFQTGMLPPQSVLMNRYIILKTIGRGGMGAVYETADQRIHGKKWAVKELSDAGLPSPQEKANAVAAFRQEAQMLAALSHPNLPVVSDFFSEGGKHYLVMEFVEGETLEDLLAASSGFLPEPLVTGWIGQICDVFVFLHSRRPPVVFRDLKPSNVMIDNDGRIKLIDFGIARFFKAGKASDTQAMGTPGYAAPEQFGTGQTDARSDVYSLGVLLHQLLTRYEPWSTPFNLPPPRNINPAISPAAEAVIHKATQGSPVDRFQTVADLRQALLNPLTPQPASQPPPVQPVGAPQASLSAAAAPMAQAVPAAIPPRNPPAAPAVVPPGYVPIKAHQPIPVAPPAAVTPQTARPKAATFAAWVCILTGVDILGLVGGIAMLKGKPWGRVLGAIHLVVVILASFFFLVASMELGELAYFPSLFGGIMLGICWTALFRSNVVEWFKPGQSCTGQPPRGIKAIGIWFLILSPGGLLTLPAGIGLLKGKKWGWWVALIEAWLGVGAGLILLVVGIADYMLELIGASGPIILIFTWCALYLLRKDVRQAFGV